MRDHPVFDGDSDPTQPVWDPASPPTDPNEGLTEDPYLRHVVDAHGPLQIEPAEAFFERFVTSILRQQVSMASAAATRERLFDAVEVTPEGILAADEAVLRDVGLSRQKVRYVRNLAEAFRSEGYDRAHFADMSDDEVRAELTGITGIGEWTVDMQLLFTLGREDVFPVGDLGVRQGLRRIVGDDDEELTRAEMRRFARRWRPYRSYATLYLWRANGDDDGADEVVGGA